MAIEFGVSRLRAYTNGWETGCAITTGVGGTAVVATGLVWIGGVKCNVTAIDVDVSALSPAAGDKYIFGRLAAGQSSTATLDATGVDPRSQGWAVIGFGTLASNDLDNFAAGSGGTSGITGLRPFGRAMNCTINIRRIKMVRRA